MIETGVGFQNPLFFIGVVENNTDQRLEGRVQVRAFGVHGTINQIPTANLPWATLIIGSHDTNFVVPPLNSWVFGLFLDGRSAQQPLILGLIPTQFSVVNDPSQSGWGVATGNNIDVNAKGSRAQDFGQPSLSRLARGEELQNTYLLPLETNRKRDIPIAGGGSSTLGSVGNMGVASQDNPVDQSNSSQSGDISKIVQTGPGYNIVQLADGSIIKQDGTRAWRNNNPGNINYGSFAVSQGAIGSDGRFAIFPNYTAGRVAKENLLFSSSAYSNLSIGQAISKYAPSSENDTNNYISQITNSLNVSSDTQLSSLTASQRENMLSTMERVEGFKPGSTTVVDPSNVTASNNSSNNIVTSSTDSELSGASSASTTNSYIQTVWEEPTSGYNTIYPYNRVIETGSGHVIELDDTPGAERVMIHHTNGSYVQMTPTTTTIKSQGDHYAVNDKNYHMYVGGANIITVEGDSHILVKGNKVEEIMGNYQQIIHGNHEVGVAGQMNFNGGEQGQIRAANLILESNVENLNIKTGKTIKFESGEAIHLKSKSLFFESSKDTNIKGKQFFFEASDTINFKGNSAAFQTNGIFNLKGSEIKIGGDSKISLRASIVALDTTVLSETGAASTPSGATGATGADSAESVSRPAPPSKSFSHFSRAV